MVKYIIPDYGSDRTVNSRSLNYSVDYSSAETLHGIQSTTYIFILAYVVP